MDGSLGAFVVSLFTTMADVAVRKVVSEETGTLWKRLKETVSGWAGAPAVQTLELAPDSAKTQALVSQAVDALPAAEQGELRALAEALVAGLKAQQGNGPTGIRAELIEAAEIRLRNLTVTQGTGIDAGVIRTPGTFSLDGLNVGLPGKPQG